MTQQLRTPGGITTALNSSSRESDVISWPLWALLYAFSDTHTYELKLKSLKTK